jgi:hypothetical protein
MRRKSNFDAEVFLQQAKRIKQCRVLTVRSAGCPLRVESTGSSIRLVALNRCTLVMSSWDAVCDPFTYHLLKPDVEALFHREISLSVLKEVSLEDFKFPPYQKVFPATDYRLTKITVDAKELLNALELVSIFAKDKGWHPVDGWQWQTPVDFTLQGGSLFIEAANYQAEHRIDAVIRGPNVETFRLNALRLLPFLETVAGCVTLYPYRRPSSGYGMMEFVDRDFRFLLMYMRRGAAVSEEFSDDEPIFAGGSDNDEDWRGTEARARWAKFRAEHPDYYYRTFGGNHKQQKEDHDNTEESTKEKRTESRSTGVKRARPESVGKG